MREGKRRGQRVWRKRGCHEGFTFRWASICSICLSVCQSIHQTIHHSIKLSIYLPVSPSINLLIYLSAYISISLSVNRPHLATQSSSSSSSCRICLRNHGWAENTMMCVEQSLACSISSSSQSRWKDASLGAPCIWVVADQLIRICSAVVYFLLSTSSTIIVYQVYLTVSDCPYCHILQWWFYRGPRNDQLHIRSVRWSICCAFVSLLCCTCCVVRVVLCFALL